MGLLTIPDAVAKYPRLVSEALLDAPSIKCMIDRELRGLVVPSRIPDNRVMIEEASIQDFLYAYLPTPDPDGANPET